MKEERYEKCDRCGGALADSHSHEDPQTQRDRHYRAWHPRLWKKWNEPTSNQPLTIKVAKIKT